MRISDWSSDVCSSDLQAPEGDCAGLDHARRGDERAWPRSADLAVAGPLHARRFDRSRDAAGRRPGVRPDPVRGQSRLYAGAPYRYRSSACPSDGGHRRRSEEHTSELQSLMRISYAVFCLKNKTRHKKHIYTYKLLLPST